MARPCAAAIASSPSAPDWVMKAQAPRALGPGGMSRRNVAAKRAPGCRWMMPAQLGPTTVRSCCAMSARSAASRALPASPASAKPPGRMMRWRCPLSAASRTASRMRSRRMTMTATSAGSLISASERRATWPNISPPLGLTGITVPAKPAMRSGRGEARLQRRRHPDVIESPAAIGQRPIVRAIAPPRIEPLLARHETAHRVDEARRILQPPELRDLDRRVAHDLEQLLVRPHIGFERRDVEVADDDHRLLRVALGAEPCGDLVEELQLVREFRVDIRIGDVAAGGDVDVVQLDAAGQRDHAVAAILALAPALRAALVDFDARDDGDAVIALHAVHELVLVSQRVEGLAREMLVRRLGLLQAEHVRLRRGDEAPHRLDAQPHRVDVPGGEGERHRAESRLSRW